VQRCCNVAVLDARRRQARNGGMMEGAPRPGSSPASCARSRSADPREAAENRETPENAENGETAENRENAENGENTENRENGENGENAALHRPGAQATLPRPLLLFCPDDQGRTG